jgi:hypothetical protein
MTLATAHATGWPAIVKERQSDRQPDSLGKLVRFMRNALAHGNVEFLSNPSGDIAALRLWNTDRGRRTWGAIVTVADMRSFLRHFVRLAEERHGRRVKSSPQIA